MYAFFRNQVPELLKDNLVKPITYNMEDQITGTGKPDDYPGYDHASFEKRTSKQGYFYVESPDNEETESFTEQETAESNIDSISTNNTNPTENNMETGNNTIAIFRSPEE